MAAAKIHRLRKPLGQDRTRHKNDKSPQDFPHSDILSEKAKSTEKNTVSLEREEALRYLEKGNESHREGEIEGAIENYKKSIELHPTADAHTFLGWMYSFQGLLEAAIEECKTAISIDPDFGNPYNDIGVYLMQQGRIDEAEPWFRKALQARRYEPRHFPHLNLGRIPRSPPRIRESTRRVSQGRGTGSRRSGRRGGLP